VTAIIYRISSLKTSYEDGANDGHPVCLAVDESFFISAAQCGFNNQLISYFAKKLPELNPALVLSTGASQTRTAFIPEQVATIIGG
jgi:hypothetical protein